MRSKFKSNNTYKNDEHIHTYIVKKEKTSKLKRLNSWVVEAGVNMYCTCNIPCAQYEILHVKLSRVMLCPCGGGFTIVSHIQPTLATILTQLGVTCWDVKKVHIENSISKYLHAEDHAIVHATNVQQLKFVCFGQTTGVHRMLSVRRKKKRDPSPNQIQGKPARVMPTNSCNVIDHSFISLCKPANIPLSQMLSVISDLQTTKLASSVFLFFISKLSYQDGKLHEANFVHAATIPTPRPVKT